MDDNISFDQRLSHDYPSLIERWKHFAGNADLNFREICISEGIPVYELLSENKEKQNVERFDLCKEAAAMKQIIIASLAKDRKKLLKEKLQTSESTKNS